MAPPSALPLLDVRPLLFPCSRTRIGVSFFQIDGMCVPFFVWFANWSFEPCDVDGMSMKTKIDA